MPDFQCLGRRGGARGRKCPLGRTLSVQELQGTGNPFARLTALLNEGDYEVAAIDAPFSIPVAHIPVGGHAELLENVALFPTEGRPFAKGEKLVALRGKSAP